MNKLILLVQVLLALNLLFNLVESKQNPLVMCSSNSRECRSLLDEENSLINGEENRLEKRTKFERFSFLKRFNANTSNFLFSYFFNSKI